jgi:hypothetical protein
MLERRATYLALVHEHYLVDMLTEEDVAGGRLRDYDVLYVVDPNVKTRATAAIEQWVRDGGYVFGACGAGSRDEFNEPGPGLTRVFGIEPAIRSEVDRGEYRVRGSLNGMDYVDQVKLDRTPLVGEPAAFGVLGVKVSFTPTSGQVIGRFKGSAPAAVTHEFGSGKALYVGACPGLSYLKDAGFVPAELKERYPPVQRRVLTGLAASRGVARLAELSHPVVEAGLYDAPAGTALVLANFTYRPIERLTVRVPLAKPVQVVRSADHGRLEFTAEPASAALRQQGYSWVAVFTTRLGLNDIILLE